MVENEELVKKKKKKKMTGCDSARSHRAPGPPDSALRPGGAQAEPHGAREDRSERDARRPPHGNGPRRVLRGRGAAEQTHPRFGVTAAASFHVAS